MKPDKYFVDYINCWSMSARKNFRIRKHALEFARAQWRNRGISSLGVRVAMKDATPADRPPWLIWDCSERLLPVWDWQLVPSLLFEKR